MSDDEFQSNSSKLFQRKEMFGIRMDENPPRQAIPRYRMAAEKQGSLNHLSVTNEITNHLKSGVIEFMSKSD